MPLLKRSWVRHCVRMTGFVMLASVMGLPVQAQLAPVAGAHYAARASDTGYAGAVNSQGSYGAAVPLDLPPARGNLPVPVQVAYGGNRAGAAGLGWDVPLSFIFRNTTIAHRRPVPQSTFSASAPAALRANEQLSLTLAGNRIELIRNAANTAWLSRRGAAQLEVRAVGDNLLLYDGEGRTYVFSPQGAVAGTLLIGGNLYMLVSMRGPGGNSMVFDYRFEAPALPGGGTGLAIDLTRVSYNPHPTTAGCFKHSVLFSYDAPTAPAAVLSMSVLGGTVLARTRKIDKVVVFSKPSCGEDETELRTYLFSYQPDVDTQLPRLQAVTMTGQRGTPERNVTLPVAAYTYGSIGQTSGRAITFEEKPITGPLGSTNHGAFGIGYTSGTLSPEPHGPNDELIDLYGEQTFIDVNGDGRPDFKGTGGWYLNVPAGDGRTAFSQVSGFGFPMDAREKIHSAVLDVVTNMPARVNTVINDTLKQLIDMNGDGRLDVVETTLPDIDHWLIHLNRPHSTDPKKIEVVTISIPVTRMREALGTTGLSFGRVPLARRSTVPESFVPGSPGNKRKRTITEFELRDVNGDGYPDFLYNASFVRRSDPQGVGSGDMVGSRDVKVLINTAGVHLADGTHLFAAPTSLEAGSLAGCGISRWQADPSSESGGILNQSCGIEDVNGDGLADRIKSVVQDGQIVAQAALGTGLTARPFATDALISLPGPLGRTETALTLADGVYAPTACTPPNQGSTFDIRRTRALRDINGDGIPDYIAGQLQQRDPGIWTVAMGTGAGFAAASSVSGLPTGLELSRERSSCGNANSAGQVSATPTGLYDIDGDGQPEIVNLNRVDPNNPRWEVFQLRPPVAQAGLGAVASAPAAARLTRIDNGYGASTRISYKSAKEDSIGAHNVPYPEIVAAVVTPTDTAGTALLSSTRYAYGGSALVFDSVLDAFIFPGYHRSVQLVATDPVRADDGMATITDLYKIESFPFSASQYPDAIARFRRYQRVGQVRDVTSIAGTLGTNPWALLAVNVSNDARRIAGARYNYDVRLLPAGVAPTNNEACVDMMFPYDFTLSQANALSNDQCTLVGFAFQQDASSWRGTPGTATDPMAASALTVKSRTEVQAMDDLGRVTRIAQLNDSMRTDDDLCTRVTYATPTGSNERVLSAPASRTVTVGNCAANPEITLANQSWEYDTSAMGVKLPAGKVAAGFVTSYSMSRRRTDDGTPIPDSLGNSDIRVFDAIYDATGNPTSVSTRREDGAVRAVATTYDAFRLVPTSLRVTATNPDGNALPPQLTTMSVDPITLYRSNSTDPNGMQAGNTFDGFGRVLLSTVTPAGEGASGALSSVSYVGFAIDESGPRRIVQKVFTDPVPPTSVATSVGRTGTVFLDSLGRDVRTEVQLGADYANQVLNVGQRKYDVLGRVLFEADAFPGNQNFSTAYGTTYHFNPDGMPSCFIRGRGPQVFTQETNEDSERYPTCFTRQYQDNKEVIGTVEADALLATTLDAPFHRATYSAIGRLLNRSRFKILFGAVVTTESMDFAYDRFGNQTRLGRLPQPGSSAASLDTTWQYDSLGQVLELSEPNSATQYRSYDNWGGLTQTQWTDTTTSPASDRRIVQRYDALGRVLHSEDRTNNVIDAETVNDYVYDRPMNPSTPSVPATNVLGRLAKATAPTSATSFSYDGLGRMNAKVITDTTASPPQVYVEKRTHHGDGSPMAVDLLLPDANHRSERVSYSYDSAGRARSAVYTDGTITQTLFSATGPAAIDVFGRIRQAQYGGAAFTADFAETGRRMLNSVKVTAPSGASREIAYPAPAGEVTAFDPLGRERARREVINNDVNAPTTAFLYDAVGQLASVTRTPTSTALPDMWFSYDALGNVTALNAVAGSSGARLSYQTVDRDRICNIAYGGGAPSSTCDVKYDGVGNIIEQPSRSNGVRRFSYFANGQLKRITDGNGNDARFRYDAFGAVQQLDLTSNTSADTRKDRHFGGMISQREEVVAGVKKTVTLRSLRAPGLTATRHGAGAADPWTFSFGEARGNRFFTNQLGEFVQDVGYQAYGEAKSTGAQPGSPSYSSEQWNGGDALAALGLSKLGARLYDPVIGRFLSRDPLIIPRTAATTNPYAFANNDPVNASDPTGLSVNMGAKDCSACDAAAWQKFFADLFGFGGGGGGGGGGMAAGMAGGAVGGGTGGGAGGGSGGGGGGGNAPWDFGPDASFPIGEGPGGRGDDGYDGGRGGGGGGGSGGRSASTGGASLPPVANPFLFADAPHSGARPPDPIKEYAVPALHRGGLALSILEHSTPKTWRIHRIAAPGANGAHYVSIGLSTLYLLKDPSLEGAWDLGNEVVDTLLLRAGLAGVAGYGLKKGLGYFYRGVVRPLARSMVRARREAYTRLVKIEQQLEDMNGKLDELIRRRDSVLDGGYSEAEPVYGPHWPDHGPYAPRADELFLRPE